MSKFHIDICQYMFSLSFTSVFPYPTANLMQDSFMVKNVAYFTFAIATKSETLPKGARQCFLFRRDGEGKKRDVSYREGILQLSEGEIPVPSFFLFVFVWAPISVVEIFMCFVLLKSNFCWISDMFIEGSLEVKLPTIWTVEKQRWEESEEKRSEERRCRCAKR